MEKEFIKTFPRLPFDFEPDVVIKHGEEYYAFVKDGKYHLKFIWDGYSASFNSVDIRIDWDKVK